jgi:hypothetical protein
MRLISAHIRVLGEAYVHLWDPCPRCRGRLRRGRGSRTRGWGYHRRARRASLPDLHLRMSEHAISGRRPSTRRWRQHRTRCRRPVTRLPDPIQPPTFQKSLSIFGELFECLQLTVGSACGCTAQRHTITTSARPPNHFRRSLVERGRRRATSWRLDGGRRAAGGGGAACADISYVIYPSGDPAYSNICATGADAARLNPPRDCPFTYSQSAGPL